MVLWRTLSRTLTTPFFTRVSVPEQESWTSHSVPRTVAALYWPVVRNEPEPLPHRCRAFGFLVAFAAACARAHDASGSLSLRSVVRPGWGTLKMPPKNGAGCGGPPVLGTEESCSRPAFTSIVAPSGMSCAELSVMNVFEPGSLTFTVPLTGLTTTVLWNTGVGGGVGVGVAVGAGVGLGPGSTGAGGSIGGATAPCSKAPASQCPEEARVASRWSVPRQVVTRRLAALVAGMARTSVCPPW